MAPTMVKNHHGRQYTNWQRSPLSVGESCHEIHGLAANHNEPADRRSDTLEQTHSHTNERQLGCNVAANVAGVFCRRARCAALIALNAHR